MDVNLLELLKKIKYYIILNGIFLGIEIPLVNYLFLWVLPNIVRNPQKFVPFILVVSSLIGLITSFFFYLIIRAVLFEDYQKKILKK